MKKRRLALAICGGLLGLVVLLPTAGVLWLASTESGLKLIAARLNEKPIGRVKLTVRGAEGSLIRGFRVEFLGIDNPWVHLEFTRVAGDTKVLPLLWQTVELPRLSAETALVQVLPPPPRTGTGPPRIRFMPGTLSIHADRLTVGSGSLLLASGTRWDATAVDLATIVRSREIRVLRGGMELPYLRVQASGRLLAGWPLGLNGTARLNIHADGQPDWIIHGDYDGDLDELPITASITAPFRADLQGQALELTRGWRFNGAAVVEDFDVTAFGGGGALGLIHGKLAIAGDRNGYTAHGQLEPAGLAAGPFDVDFKGAYANRRVSLQRVLIDHPPSGAQARVQGSVFVEQGGPRLELAGDWSRFRWPLTGTEVAARSARGAFTLAGTRLWAVTANGELAPADLPSMPVTMHGTLAGDHLLIAGADLQAWGGRAQVHGEARWSPQDRWSLAGEMQGLDVAQIRADLPGRLDFGFRGEGRGFGETGDVDLAVERLSGRLRGLAARGAGAFELRGPLAARHWRFRDVNLRVGGSQLGLDGSTGMPRDLHFNLVSNDLSLLSTALHGQIHAQGRLAGDDLRPTVRLQVEGRGLEYGEDSLQNLNADVDLQLSEGGRTRGTVHARQMIYAGRAIEDLQIDLSGTANANALGINLRALPLNVALRARGAYAEGRWRGLVDSWDIHDADALELRLTEFAPLNVSRTAISLGHACLEGGGSRLCLQGDNDAGQWHAAMEALNLPLRALTAGLSRSTSYEGRVGLNLTAHGADGQLPDAQLTARLTDALLRHREPNGREQQVKLGTGSVEGSLAGDAFALRVGLDAGDSGRLVGQIEGRRGAAPWTSWPTRGTVELATDALGLVDLFVTDIDRAAGRLNAHVDVSGTLGAPRLAGTLQVRGGELDIYQVNLAIRDLDFDARLDDRALRLDGKLRAGEGSASIDGNIAWSAGEPQGRIALKGERLRLIDVPEARVEASPNLEFRIAGRRIDVSGEVDVPEARFEPAIITNAVLPSGDEVMVGTPPPDPERQFQVVSNIRLTLGEKVSIDTYGLSGRLTGSIVTRSDETQVSRASGELNVAEGKYSAFGRNLDIERGRLLFNNGPVADPGIDLRAQKVFPDVTAGVNVRGTLRAPRMTFFSEPAIPQSQIVSLILAGGSLESVQGSGRSGAARNDLLAQGGAILAQQFGNRVGIEDVGIESDLTNETSLVLGKYLSPRLYVSYGISLAEAINTVKLRYTIGDHWTLKTESGRARSADIVYTLRK